MIQAASKYERVQTSGRANVRSNVQHPTSNIQHPTGTPNLFIPTISGARTRLADWYWKEIKEGGFLHEYLRREKARTPAMLRRVMGMMQGFTQNPKSDFRRLCTVPARVYHRWKEEDQHFFEDDENLRSLKRDNPDAQVWVGGKRVKGTRKTYGGDLTAKVLADGQAENTKITERA